MYSCGFFANAGNYKGMGDTKFVPNLDEDKFEVIVKASKAYRSETEKIEYLWANCRKPIFELSNHTKSFGFPDYGVTAYFSDNCTKEDSDLVNDWLKLKKVEGYFCRTFKSVENGQNVYDVKLASVEAGSKEGVTVEPEEWNGSLFKITRGDHSELLALVCENLQKSEKYAANEYQATTISKFVESFTGGDINAHKDGIR